MSDRSTSLESVLMSRESQLKKYYYGDIVVGYWRSYDSKSVSVSQGIVTNTRDRQADTGSEIEGVQVLYGKKKEAPPKLGTE